MLYNLLYPMADDFAVFNLFKYLSFRSGAAMFTAMLIGFVVGKPVIAWLKSLQKDGQPIREDGPESHLLTKKGTPTMGGIMILGSIFASTLVWADLTNSYVWVVLFVALGFGLLGFMDDYFKLTRKDTKGVPGKLKMAWQALISIIACYFIMQLSTPEHKMQLAIPFFKDMFIYLSWLYIPFVLCVIVGSSNAVNLTDGLDGLATVPIMIAAGCFGLIAYLVGNAVYSEYLQLPPVKDAGELAVICAATMGACLGFLWWNAPPAKVFMGDTGSLSLGGMLGAMAVIVKHELVLAIIGGLFVMEAVSVMIQVYYFKLTGKRFFLMAPIHHHFEKKGWSEPTVVIRFWILAVIFALIGLSTLKLR